MYDDRKKLYNELEASRGSKVITYITGDKPGMEAQIASDVLNYFPEHLDSLAKYDGKISLFISSRGGNTLTGWGIVNLIKMYCDNFEVIIPSKALSTATLISIGADSIIMTKQATLGPIDPSINGPYNPQAPGMPPNARLPVSVEDVTKFIDLARKELGADADLTSIFSQLASNVHPLSLGSVYRSRTQIQMLASRLLRQHITGDEKIAEIISFLCSESGSHDYTINRREAKNNLHLPVFKPTADEYSIISDIYNDIRREMDVDNPFAPTILIGDKANVDYSFPRVILESLAGGSHKWVSEGKLTKIQLPPQQPPGSPFAIPGQVAINDERTFEAWRHDG